MSDSRITVAVRCRPVNELTDGSSPVVYSENSIIVKDISFKFDYIFPDSSNEEVYQSTISSKMDDLFKGINVTILAYGATGSGKTFTMGTEYDASKGDTEAGIIHRSVQDIFKKINQEEDPSSYSLRLSFIEVYGEEVYDLLQSRSTLMANIRQDNEGFKIPNVLEIPATSSEEVITALKRGCAVRKTSPTAKNAKSSRSHGIFTIFIEQKLNKTVVKRAKFLLVDLAGSERIDTSQTSGTTMKEGIGINRGLMTLRQVIKSLAEKASHAPFRDSKLTKILQDSLEGTSQTIMIACVYPISENIEETINTLRYASLANSIIIKPKPSSVSSSIQIANLKKQVAELQAALKKRKFSDGEQVEETKDVATATSPLQCSDMFYYKYINSQNAMSKLQEKCEKDLKVFQTIYDKLKTLKSELENEVDSEGNKLEVSQILDDIFGAYVELVTIESSKDTEGSDEDKIVPFNDSDECAILSEKLNEISEMMSSNADTVKNLEDLAQSVEGVDQDIVARLVKEIEKLTEEKDRLQEIVATTVDGKVNSDKERINSLVEEINKLKADLKEKKSILQQKEANKNEINRLKKENDNLKHLKVGLLKKIKEAGTKFVNLNFEKKREITQLLKNTRKMEVEKNRTVSKLEKEINVLQRKLNTISRKNNPQGTGRYQVSRKPNSSKESFEARIRDALDNVINKKTSEILNKKTEEEVKSVLPNLEQYESDAESNLTTEEKEKFQEKIQAAKFYVNTVMAKTSGEIKDQKSNINDTIRNLLNSITSVMEAKQGISLLFKEFLCIYEKMFLENDENCCKFKEQIKELEEKLNTEQQSCNDRVYQVTQEKRKAEEINQKLVEQVESLSIQLENVKNLEGEPQMVEKLKMQEVIIAELRDAIESYKKKDTEIQSLSKDLFRAKKGKSTPWLGRVPLRIPSQEEDEEQQTLVDEFLDETLEESFMDYKDDPDFRGTPLYKRKKENLARKMLDSNDDDSPPRKKSSTLGCCTCSGGCKTMRCRCRKSKLDCSHECSCKSKCSNSPNTSTD